MTIKFRDQDYLQKYDKFVFFYGGYLSNWASTPFTHAGMSFNCSEQYMMFRKAAMFKDMEVARRIMDTSDPEIQKALGRSVKNFDKDAWEKYARQIVYDACFFKFTQNKHALEYLMSTKGYYLVEASPTDTIWGIGLSEDDPKVLDPANWRGTNWLGQVLTQLREDLEEMYLG